MGPEAKIEAAVCRHAKSKGMDCYKFTSPSRRSVPDRMFIYRGRVFFIEFKAPGKKPTPGQEREIERIRKQDVKCFVCDDAAGGKFLIDTMVNEINMKRKIVERAVGATKD